ncbi:MAG: hypothetical protein AABW57_01500 [Nanoarchaeota archaeon]
MIKNFQNAITEKDELPIFDKIGLEKFFLDGYDSELGWSRKPFTSGFEEGKYSTIMFRIDEKGARFNPFYRKLQSRISIYGDSFAMSRQVNDDETIAYYLSELTQTNVLNFGVGNYGIDQSLLRMRREYEKNKTNIVIQAFVPEQILRVVSYWKHYLEYGNHFGFKPRFELENHKLRLIPNIMDNKEKFNHLIELLPEIKRYDYWYERKFKKDFGAIYDFDQRMESNLKWRVRSYKDEECFKTFIALIDLFKEDSQDKGFRPILTVLPYKNDILFSRESNNSYYNNFIEECRNKLTILDLMENFINLDNLDLYFSDNTKYGGHYSKHGNKLVAKVIFDRLKKEGAL